MKIDRRSMLAMLPTVGVSLSDAFAERAGNAPSRTTSDPGVGETRQLSKGWEFSYDGETQRIPVEVPHTWQALDGNAAFVGSGTYRLMLQPEPTWDERWVRLECEAAYHTAHVTLNGKPVGEHTGKGYTAFTCDLSPALQGSGNHELVITVNNEPGDTMLPRNKSYDWADDGGLTRPVNLLVTPTVFIEYVKIDAQPYADFNNAIVSIKAVIRNAGPEPRAIELSARFWPEKEPTHVHTAAPARQKIAARTTVTVELAAMRVEPATLWHFDTPELYAAELLLHSEDGTHAVQQCFGIRSFAVKGTRFLLNGEPVSFMGVERMAGSNPNFGMAETWEWIRDNHHDMKRLNCIYTRVHWPQDKRVLEYCDRNGILMQEEIPAWGAATFHETTDAVQQALEQNGLEQLREMIGRDRNHPSIVTWGLCNEVNGKNPRTQRFAHLISKEATRLDPKRLQTYASNTLFDDPGTDMAGDFSFVSTNEYFGSWKEGGVPDVKKHIEGIRAAFPNKPIVVSEYGWCECQPKIMPGDNNRVDIVNRHTDVFRESGQVAGAIYFDYNDYRTLVGDKGLGAFQQRVHGVVDLYGRQKASFDALRLQSSPFENLAITRTTDFRLSLQMAVRQRLPGYTLRGYQVRWIMYGYDDLPMAGFLETLPDLSPGDEHIAIAPDLLEPARRVVADVLRPNGFSVATVVLHLQDATC